MDSPVLAGYYSRVDSTNLHQEAAVFMPTFDLGGEINGWSVQAIEGTQLNTNGYLYTHSIATDINRHLIVVGSSKRGNYDGQLADADVTSQSGSLNNRLWVANASQLPITASYLSEGIFFDGAGGKIHAINDFNEIVGNIDFNDKPEINGTERLKRGFIYPHDATGIIGARSDIFKNQAWWLDDLTNDGTLAGHHNKFRIIDANDINNAGIIAATA